MRKIKLTSFNKTDRGFLNFDFTDRYGKKFSIRQSSANLTDFWIFVEEDSGYTEGHDLLISKKIFRQMKKAIKIIHKYWKYKF